MTSVVLTERNYWSHCRWGQIWGQRRDGYALARRDIFKGTPYSRGADVVVVGVRPYPVPKAGTVVYLVGDYKHDRWQRADHGRQL